MWTKAFNATAYAVAMAYLESTIVVYLRRLYYPHGFAFPLVIIDGPTLLLEFGREACTVVMLAAMGIAAGRTKTGKLAYFLYLFGIWDTFYYVWLKVFLNWPTSLMTWDVTLFGGTAFAGRLPFERCFRDARAGLVMGQDNDMAYDTIGTTLFPAS